jgi:DNA (cytosine-5)-methyltransferase 1
MAKEKLKVVELFAGVGGFRIGLERAKNYEVVWSNQWEPMTKVQHASLIYESQFGKDGHSNDNIEDVPSTEIPTHDVLCGGFPCQDYSVASTLKNSKGLIGKKGVLWWSIHRIISEKRSKPEILILENVDRLLNSPSTQRGRDFGVILKSLDELGYAVEWRVINAADYGMPQRRKRIFFLGYKKNSTIYKKLKQEDVSEWISKTGAFASEFPVEKIETVKEIDFKDDLVSVSNNFNKNSKKSIFENTGVMIDGKIYTTRTRPFYKGKQITIEDILQEDAIPNEFFISKTDLPKWNYLKGAKREERTTAAGYTFTYSEGAVGFPDKLDGPSRTIITSEGGASPSRFRHVIRDGRKLRRLTPLELERLNMFPDNFTKFEGVTDSKRAFIMGNALVVGVVEKIGKSLSKIKFDE